MKRRPRTIHDAALFIVETLRAGGHAALFAGGSVRDRLLGVQPKDIDVATDATPKRVAELFPKARHVGAKFGVMIVRKFGHEIEVATFRSDGRYSDGRHPDEVIFGTESEDALRRDFTINGLFFDPVADRVIDHVAGLADLRAGVIRTIGDADRRFAEDHLRMLRAIRFASRLGFEIEHTTLSAIKRLAPHLEAISAERVWMELEAILTAPTRARAWDLLAETGLRGHLCRRWPSVPEEDELTGRRLAGLPDVTITGALALAACTCSRTDAEVAGICRALRVSNRLLKAVVSLVRGLPVAHGVSELDLAGLKLLMAGTDWGLLLELLRVDLLATRRDLTAYNRLRERALALAPAEVAPPPLLTGDDLAAIGLAPGPRFGRILAVVYRAQLNEQITSREEALALARQSADSTPG